MNRNDSMYTKMALYFSDYLEAEYNWYIFESDSGIYFTCNKCENTYIGNANYCPICGSGPIEKSVLTVIKNVLSLYYDNYDEKETPKNIAEYLTKLGWDLDSDYYNDVKCEKCGFFINYGDECFCRKCGWEVPNNYIVDDVLTMILKAIDYAAIKYNTEQ